MRKQYKLQIDLEVEIDGGLSMPDTLISEKIIDCLYISFPCVLFDSEDTDSTKELDCMISTHLVEITQVQN